MPSQVLASESLRHLSVQRGWTGLPVPPGLFLLSHFPLSGLVPSYPNHQPFTHSFPEGPSQPSPCSLLLCSPMVLPATTVQFSLVLPWALHQSLIILCQAGLHSWVWSVCNVVVCLFVYCLFWSSWRLLTDKHWPLWRKPDLSKHARVLWARLRISGWRELVFISSSPQLCSHS